MKGDKRLYFRRGYKYQTAREFSIKLEIAPLQPVRERFMSMEMDGSLTIFTGYAWDGASGPTWDTKSSMRGSLVHDVLYQLIRLKLIDPKHKEYADQVLHDLCTADGMWSWRADYWRWAVLTFGSASCEPDAEPEEEAAP